MTKNDVAHIATKVSERHFIDKGANKKSPVLGPFWLI
jgi:hypothetical protein